MSDKNTQFTKAQNKLLSLHADVKAHEILVLLLRLRQVCVHPSLVRSMLDEEDIKESGITESENLDSDLLLQINKITLEDEENNEEDTNETEIGVDRRVATNLLTSKNPVFKSDRISSKVGYLSFFFFFYYVSFASLGLAYESNAFLFIF